MNNSGVLIWPIRCSSRSLNILWCELFEEYADIHVEEIPLVFLTKNARLEFRSLFDEVMTNVVAYFFDSRCIYWAETTALNFLTVSHRSNETAHLYNGSVRLTLAPAGVLVRHWHRGRSVALRDSKRGSADVLSRVRVHVVGDPGGQPRQAGDFVYGRGCTVWSRHKTTESCIGKPSSSVWLMLSTDVRTQNCLMTDDWRAAAAAAAAAAV